MQTTNFNLNFSIFDKKFIPEFVTQTKPSRPIDMKQQLDGNEFWPKQYKSSNKKRTISKSFKFLKRKFSRKICKRKDTVAAEEIMVSKITYNTPFSTDEINEFFGISSYFPVDNGVTSVYSSYFY